MVQKIEAHILRCYGGTSRIYSNYYKTDLLNTFALTKENNIAIMYPI